MEIEYFKIGKYSKEFIKSVEETREKIIVCIGNRVKTINTLEDNDKKLFEYYAKILGLKISLMELK